MPMVQKAPKHLVKEDQETRIRKLKKNIEELTGGQTASFTSDDLSPEIEEQFWEHVLDFEQAKLISPLDMLFNGGMSLLRPDQLDDEQLSAKLLEMIQGLALLGVYLHNTNHFSDRELYEYLWKDALREPAVLQPSNPDFAYHIDTIGSRSEEDILTGLKYYADAKERRMWAKEWPDYPMPEHLDPPFDRDRHLPTPDRIGMASSSNTAGSPKSLKRKMHKS